MNNKPNHFAFTLIEVLVSIGILLILIGILAPSFGRAVDVSQGAVCGTNVRGIAQSFASFAAEHQGFAPGTQRFDHDVNGKEAWKNSWMGNEIGRREAEASEIIEVPIDGEGGTDYWHPTAEETLVPYVGGRGQAAKMYRCPSQFVGELGSGNGSNGMFDYVSIGAFNGAKTALIPATSSYNDPAGVFTGGSKGDWRTTPTVMIVEESPKMSINTTHYDPLHSHTDQIATTHNGNSGNVGAVDGSVSRLSFQRANLGAVAWHDWRVRAPSGKTINLRAWDEKSGTYGPWGFWNRQ